MAFEGDLAYRTAAFLGRDDVWDLLESEHVPLVVAFVKAYTRGRGFTEEGLADDLAAVVITAAARLVTNPAQLEREHAGEYIAVGSFAGWTLPELAVLHRYRRRTA
jgi:hypothetical protein